MSERKKYTVTINGTKYPITTEEPEEYIRKIEFYLNTKIQDAKEKTGMHYSDSITLALLSIELCDALFQNQSQFNGLKNETDKLLEKFDEFSAKYEAAISELEKKNEEIDRLEKELLELKIRNGQ